MTLRHNKTIIQMVKDGWNFNQIQDLFNESRAKEREFVREINYFESHRITDFSKINFYYCQKHQCYHQKYRYAKTKVSNKSGFSISERVKTKTFEKCKEFALELNKSEIFNQKFKKSWKKYNKNEHSKRNGSRLQ